MPVRAYRDTDIIKRVESLESFKGWKDGVIDVWVKSDEDEFDRFDDKVYTFEVTKGVPKFIMVCTGTTNAGAQGLLHFDEYNALGCAVLKSDTIVYNSHRAGKHKGYDAYVQNVGFPYFRDADKDKKAEEVGKEYKDIIGANCHKAGLNSTLIGGWSVACLVRNQLEQYNKWLRWMAKRPLTVVILKEFKV